MNIFIVEKNEINKSAVELLKREGHVIFFDITDQKLAGEIEALFIRTYTNITTDYLDSFPQLRYIIRAGVGLDNIDLEECKKRNIQVFNAPGSNANAVAEFVISMMINLKHNTFLQQSRILEKEWRDPKEKGSEMKGGVIGLVGCGAIGRLIAHKLQTFEIGEVIGFDPYLDEENLKKNHIRKVDLSELYQRSDIISLHVPLTDETRNMISEKEFKQMKKTAYLINTSRGGIINEIDLVGAVEKGMIAGAALDVFEDEPRVREELLHNPRIVKTPHIAGYTNEADESMATEAAKNFLKMVQ